MGDEAVRVSRLAKRYGAAWALRDLDFAIPGGQVCALLGPNGAGKTTAIQVLLGLTLPTAGVVEIAGRDVVSDRTEAVRRTNFAASYVSLPSRLDVAEVLRVFCDLYEVADWRRAIRESSDLVGVGELLGQRAHHLSSGQQVLVGLTKALLTRPRLRVLDEPTANLDPSNAVAVRAALGRVGTAWGTTVLLTSHNMAEVERVADRVLFLRAGRLLADASPEQLRASRHSRDLEEAFVAMAHERSVA